MNVVESQAAILNKVEVIVLFRIELRYFMNYFHRAIFHSTIDELVIYCTFMRLSNEIIF